LISFISQTIRLNLLSPYELIIPFIIGFFIIDIYYGVRYKIYYNKLENDLLQAVMIMNNAFKAGKSITQAVEIVSIELDGPIGNEFNKILVELNFGLDLDVVFSRFEERIKLKEAEYLTASLSVLNNTGGDIIKIFNSIEKTLIEKKKLQFELDALTASSKIILYVLFIVPILFVLFITMLEPTYFNPFFTTNFGIAIFMVAIILYIIYIYIISKLMKVRM
jgi:tight adherence protein B